MADSAAVSQQQQQQQQRKEIYTYEAPWTVFSLAWSNRIQQNSQFRLAIGSYIEKYENSVQILKTRYTTTQQQQHHHHQATTEPMMDIYSACTIEHPYPCTKILWSPEGIKNTSSAISGGNGGGNFGSRDLLATTGDYLRIWSVSPDDEKGGGMLKSNRECMLNNNTKSDYCSPLTSFDWNEYDPSIIGTSSIDTTCTIWDINTSQAKTQLIAHEREVFDIAFSAGTDVFATVGADGSVRMFDQRNLEHSTIIYETPNLEPLLRLEWNKQDHNYLATFKVDSLTTTILDIRVPSMPVTELGGHHNCGKSC